MPNVLLMGVGALFLYSGYHQCAHARENRAEATRIEQKNDSNSYLVQSINRQANQDNAGGYLCFIMGGMLGLGSAADANQKRKEGKLEEKINKT